MRKFSWIESIVTASLLLAAFYCILPTFSRCWQFTHPDIAFNYYPFREWFLSELHAFRFPLWDPYAGLGRFAESWTTIPIDLFTPFELLFGKLDFANLSSLQVFFAFILVYLAFALAKFPLPAAMFGAVFFLLSPGTNYFHLHYIHTWPYLLFTAAFFGLFLWIRSGRLRPLTFVAASAFIFSLGGKAEGLFMVMICVLVGTCLFILFDPDRRLQAERAALGLSAFYCAILVHFWALNLFLIAAASSSRTETLPYTYFDFLESLAAITNDRFLLLIAFAAILGFAERAKNSSKAFTLLIQLFNYLTLVLGVHFSFQNLGSSALGYPLGFIFAFIYLLLPRYSTRAGQQEILRCIPAFLVVLYYFCRPLPGDLDEIQILRSSSPPFQFLTTFLVCVGILAKSHCDWKRWSLAFLTGLIVIRSLGVVLLSYGIGFIWLNTRDNFLFELPLALLATVGLLELMESILIRFQKYKSPKYLVQALPMLPVVAAFIILATNPHLALMPLTCKTVLPADRIREQMLALFADNKPMNLAPTRTLHQIHGYARLGGMAEVREYQSLLMAPYNRYAISQRLGIPPELTQGLTNFTKGMSEHLKQLSRRYLTPEDIRPELKLIPGFYESFTMLTSPPLNCDHLRLLGVEYIQRDSAFFPVQHLLNLQYSRLDVDSKTIAPDVAEALKDCQFTVRAIGGFNSYWQNKQVLPRAIFLIGATPADLPEFLDDRTRVKGEIITLNGRNFRWEPVKIERYEPNRILLHYNSMSAGLLLLSDLYSEHWIASVNGSKANIVFAFSLLRALELAPGESKIEFQIPYPRKWIVILVTLLAIAGLAGTLMLARRRHSA